jgi:hypothetical protein
LRLKSYLAESIGKSCTMRLYYCTKASISKDNISINKGGGGETTAIKINLSIICASEHKLLLPYLNYESMIFPMLCYT